MSGAPAASDAVPAQAAGQPGVPRHVAIIMDGNGRWAKKRFLPRVAGHRAGADALRRTLRAAVTAGIEVLTLYAFSSENWRRPAAEIADLMGLLRHYIRAEIDELAEAGIRLRIIGDYRRFEPDVVALVDEAMARTAANRRATLVIALNYGAQDEIVRAVQAIVAEGIAPATIDPSTIAARLDTADLPPLDLLIRTSGERRLSNFLLWQAAYAELLFVDTLWPDFDAAALNAAVADFAGRERRYGGL
ncbi:isoprenyl transferase [Sphingomonas sp.]|uniref:isoprenyl transferase n=1 Tax=Sphingomonas sp. TaxID=28214 RepID=UPI0039C969A4